jgi:hypothetical protein
VEIEASFAKFVNNFNLSKPKTKWEVISQLSELYLKTGILIREISLTNELKEKGNLTPTNLAPYEKYRTEILDLIKILSSSQT